MAPFGLCRRFSPFRVERSFKKSSRTDPFFKPAFKRWSDELREGYGTPDVCLTKHKALLLKMQQRLFISKLFIYPLLQPAVLIIQKIKITDQGFKVIKVFSVRLHGIFVKPASRHSFDTF